MVNEFVKVIRSSGKEGIDHRYLAEYEIRLINVDDTTDFEVSTWSGLGIDSGDKAMPKAATAALKMYMLNEFLIPSGINDEERPYEETVGMVPQEIEYATDEQVDSLRKIIKTIDPDNANDRISKWEDHLVQSDLMADGKIKKSDYDSVLTITKQIQPPKKKEPKEPEAAGSQ